MKKAISSASPDPEAASPGVTYKVPAGEKTLDVIEYMAYTATPQTKSEIAAGVGKSIQEIYRIIQLLVGRGYLISGDNEDRYSLSMKLFSLVHTMPAVRSLSAASVGPMRRLVAAASQSCHLGVLWGNELMVVSQLNSPLNMSYAVALGARFPAHETSSGLVLLAGLPPDHLARALSRMEQALHPDESIAVVRRLVDEVRHTGHDVRPSLMVPGIVNISYPVRGLHGETIAALTVPYLGIKRSTLSVEATAAATSQAADDISLAMGCPASVLGLP